MRSFDSVIHRYMYKNIASVCSVAFVLCSTTFLSYSANAAETPESDGIYDLGQIVVRDQLPSIGTDFHINRDDMERLSARSLDEALKMIPSINVRNGADGTPRLDIRGLRTRQIKLLVNGVPFNSTYDGQFDPTLIPTFAIGSIDLKAGASSVLYGDGGMGGVLDIHTRGNFSGFKAGGQAELGSDQFWHTNAYAGYGDDKNNFFVAAGIRARDSFPMSSDFSSSIPTTRDNYQNDNHRNNSDYRRSNLITSYSRQVTDALKLGFFITHLQGNYGKPPSVLDCKGNSPTCLKTGDPYATTTKYERAENQIGTTIQVGGDYDFNDRWNGHLWFFNNQFNEDLMGYDNANYNTFTTKNTYSETDKTQIRGVHSQLNGKVGPYNTALGFSFDSRSEQFDSNGFSCDKSKCTKSGDFSTIDVNKTTHIRSIATELTQPLPDDMQFVIGVAHHQLDKDGGRDDSANSARVGLSKQLNQISMLYATVARKVDSPTIRQLYDAKSGNNSLGFQRANHYEVGLKNRWDRASVDVSAYESRVYDFIEKDDTTNLYVNRQELLFKGVDVMASLQATSALLLRGGLGLLRSSDESSNAASRTLQYRPNSKLTMEAEYKISAKWKFNANYQRIGEQAYFSKTDPSQYKKLKAFNIVSTKISYQLPANIGSYYIGVDNLFDENYSTSYGFPQSGRFLYTGVNFIWQ